VSAELPAEQQAKGMQNILRFVPGCPLPWSDRSWVAFLMLNDHLKGSLVCQYLSYGPDWPDHGKLEAILHSIASVAHVAIDLIGLEAHVVELIATDPSTRNAVLFRTTFGGDFKIENIERRINLDPLEWQDLGSPEGKTHVYGSSRPPIAGIVERSSRS